MILSSPTTLRFALTLKGSHNRVYPAPLRSDQPAFDGFQIRSKTLSIMSGTDEGLYISYAKLNLTRNR